MVELRTSFIPQKPAVSVKEKRGAPLVDLTIIVPMILFFALLAVTGGLYFFKVSLEKRIETMSVSLDRAREAVDPALVESLKRLDYRIQAADLLIEKHLIVSPVFKLLENLTLSSIELRNFTYTLDGMKGSTISLTGKARGYSSLALQSDVFGEDINIVNPIFSSLGLDSEGSVLFNFTSPINTNLLRWKNNVQNPSNSSTRSTVDTEE